MVCNDCAQSRSGSRELCSIINLVIDCNTLASRPNFLSKCVTEHLARTCSGVVRELSTGT